VKRLLPALLVSAVLVALLVAITDLEWRSVADTLRALDPGYVALAFAVYAASFVGRGVRLTLLLPGTGNLTAFTSISARHIFLAVVLPFRSGEASLPIMLTQECGRPLHEGISVLALMRVFDLMSVAAWLVLGLLLTAGGAAAGSVGSAGAVAAPGTDGMLLKAVALLVLLLAGLATLPLLARRVSHLAGSPRVLLAFAGRTATHVASLSRSQLLLTTLASLATWAATYGACFLLLRAMATPGALGAAAGDIDFATSLVGTTGLHLSAVIPISPLAGVGTWEVGWTTGYVFAGMSKDAAATSAVVSHILVFTFITLLGGAGWLLRPRRKPAPSPA
jgi:glycosyltransferase 2 family protein